MSEIYKGTTNKAFNFGLPGATVSKAEFVRNGEVVATVTNNATVAIPYAVSRKSGPFLLRWTFTVNGAPYTEEEVHHIVTPLFTKDELFEWDSDFDSLSESKVQRLESIVRQIVQTYCNQKFESSTKTVNFKSMGNGVYMSPERIVSIHNTDYRVSSDMYSVYKWTSRPQEYPNVKIPIEAEEFESGYHAPRYSNALVITGDFGWHSVPDEVKTAALYLAEAFSCDESLWRERYIKSVRAADWRFDYSEESFRSTGSLVADQLLDPYVKLGLAVL